eukprot:2916892-Pleurochrysis_carterae.AAC.1
MSIVSNLLNTYSTSAPAPPPLPELCEAWHAESACMPGAVGIDGACYVLTSARAKTCGGACGGADVVDVEATRDFSSSSTVVLCLEHILHLQNRHDIFDQLDEPCPGIHLLISDLERWHCYPQFTPLDFPVGFRAPC